MPSMKVPKLKDYVRLSRFVLAYAIAAILIFVFSSDQTAAQQTENEKPPVIVQPGAPGQPTRVLPPDTRAKLPPVSAKDIEFMRGMIVHHLQAVEMTDLIMARTENADLRSLGARIARGQTDEMDFMKKWLAFRGIDGSENAGSAHGSTQHKMMPGMLTRQQMDALRRERGGEFDRLFLAGMIQHHEGALTMVKDLFDAAGAGQDAELFSFATDVDSGQRAEIKTMQTLLASLP